MSELIRRFETATMIAAAAKRGLTQIPTMDAQALLLILKDQEAEIERLKAKSVYEDSSDGRDSIGGSPGR